MIYGTHSTIEILEALYVSVLNQCPSPTQARFYKIVDDCYGGTLDSIVYYINPTLYKGPLFTRPNS